MSNLIMLFVAFALIFATAASAFAEHDTHSHDHETQSNVQLDTDDISVEEGEVVIVVQGIVCSFCSQGVRRKLSKLPFIDSTKYKKGVKVEIENQKVTIAIKPDSDLDMDQVFKSIKSGGYEPVVAINNVDGEMVNVYPEG